MQSREQAVTLWSRRELELGSYVTGKSSLNAVDGYDIQSWSAEADEAVSDSVRFGKGMMAKHALLYGPNFSHAQRTPTKARRFEDEPW